MTRPSRILSAPSIGRAVAELVLIVAGVLIALGVDGLMEREREREVARESLSLIRNDLSLLVEQLVELEGYAESTLAASGRAYETLGRDGLLPRSEETWTDLLTLFGRRTVRFPRAAYDELVGTGNLRALEDLELRAALVRFYESLSRDEQIILRNNEAFTDDLLNGLLIGRGLLLPLPESSTERYVVDVLADGTREMAVAFPPGPTWEGRIWELGPDHPDRRALRAAAVAVGRVAGNHRALARSGRESAEALVARIDASLGRAGEGR